MRERERMGQKKIFEEVMTETSWDLVKDINYRYKVKVAQSHPTICDPMDWILQARILEWVVFPFSRRSFQPRDQTQVSCIVGRRFTVWATREAQPETKSTSSTLQVDSLPFEPPGKPKNTGVGSLFLLQGIFPTQGSNPGLLHCRQTL